MGIVGLGLYDLYFIVRFPDLLEMGNLILGIFHRYSPTLLSDNSGTVALILSKCQIVGLSEDVAGASPYQQLTPPAESTHYNYTMPWQTKKTPHFRTLPDTSRHFRTLTDTSRHFQETFRLPPSAEPTHYNCTLAAH